MSARRLPVLPPGIRPPEEVWRFPFDCRKADPKVRVSPSGRNPCVKIPATEPGLGAVEATIAAGAAVNVTPVLSLARHRAIIEAYLRGLERLREAGGDVGRTSVASFFVSRVDTETDRRLDAIGGHDRLRGRLAIAKREARLSAVP
jgi:transaldolase